ncbi:MAG: hypothetical protein HYY37_02290 [Candidatus Aenigmarchaeota archaeon]|nr:hypothetical protein [Candidatus Aenigmarchaeota archaeon]
MKGQYIIVNEILIFAIGLAITSFVILNFALLENTLKEKATRSQLSLVSDAIASAIVIVGKTNATNMTVSFSVPETVSEQPYLMRIHDANGRVCERGERCLLNISTASVSFTREIFKLEESYNLRGSVHSATRYVQVRSAGGTIDLLRG